MKIGIFDSGIGGLSVLSEALHRLPDEEYLFYADTDHVPYGIKDPEEITEYVDGIVKDLCDRGVQAVVIACNTATAVAASHVRSKYDIPIIGMEPAVKPAVEGSSKKGGRVLVMATPVTIRENKLRTLLEKVDKEHKVDLLPMPGLVRFAEAGVFDTQEVEDYIEEQLAVFEKDRYSVVVLGCTHFNYFKPAIRKAFQSKITFIDGNEGTVRRIASLLNLQMNPEQNSETHPEQNSETNSGSKDTRKNAYGKVTYLESGREVSRERVEEFYTMLLDRLDMVRNI